MEVYLHSRMLLGLEKSLFAITVFETRYQIKLVFAVFAVVLDRAEISHSHKLESVVLLCIAQIALALGVGIYLVAVGSKSVVEISVAVQQQIIIFVQSQVYAVFGVDPLYYALDF